jgi:zinc protease
MQKKIYQQVLDNGLTVLVVPKKDAPKVAIQLWYDVGSKHEKDGQKGMAHLIEHMIFKGTQKLSESDINLISTKLSGYCNAYTSYDYTAYVFDIPTANWAKILPVMADCVYNCHFEQEYLNSELKAVIQELKLYKDDYSSMLHEELVTAIFADHPYHYPIIGYKQDLWNLQRQTLVDFYKQHYAMQRAGLVIVGDVDPEQVMQEVRAAFGHLPKGADYTHQEMYINKDLRAKSVKLTREVEQPIGMVAYTLPGSKERVDYLIEVICLILASGKASRLYKKLVDELQLVTSIHAFSYDLADQTVLFIEFKPKDEQKIDDIISLIQQEIDSIVHHGVTDLEERRATKQAYVSFLDTLEETDKQAYTIGKYFTILKDPNYIFEYASEQKEVGKKVQDMLGRYCRASVRHEGRVVALPESEAQYALELQELSDKEDERILKGKVRTLPVQDGVFVHTISVQDPVVQAVARPIVQQTDNAVTLLSCHKDDIEKIDIIIEYKAHSWFDPDGKEGIGALTSALMLEGTKKYPGSSFVEELESYGMEIYTAPGYISLSMLSSDIQKGCEFLEEILLHATLAQDELQKIKAKYKQRLKAFWDEPRSFASQMAKEYVYAGHQNSKYILGTQQTLDAITIEDVVAWYTDKVSPWQARVAIVGNFKNQEVEKYVARVIEKWEGAHVADLVYPELHNPAPLEIKKYMNRDQVVLAFTQLSLPRMHEYYEHYNLFNEIFTGGTLGAMSSKLFELREATGLFYTIGGSLLSGSCEQPGMMMIRTIVSNDRLDEAQTSIAHTISSALQTVTADEYKQAQNALLYAIPAQFETYQKTAEAFLFLDRYKLPADYFEQKAALIKSISQAHMTEILQPFMDSSRCSVIKIGRI